MLQEEQEDADGQTNGGMFLIKYNTEGDKQWTQQLINGHATGVATDLFGDIYITGTGLQVDGNTNIGNGDSFIVKFNSSGEKFGQDSSVQYTQKVLQWYNN